MRAGQFDHRCAVRCTGDRSLLFGSFFHLILFWFCFLTFRSPRFYFIMCPKRTLTRRKKEGRRRAITSDCSPNTGIVLFSCVHPLSFFYVFSPHLCAFLRKTVILMRCIAEKELKIIHAERYVKRPSDVEKELKLTRCWSSLFLKLVVAFTCIWQSDCPYCEWVLARMKRRVWTE